MNSKEILLSIFIAVIVAVVVFFVFSATGIALAPPWETTNEQLVGTEINAHRCQADGVCEMNDLSANSGEIVDLGVLGTLSTNVINSNVDMNIISDYGAIVLSGYDGVKVSLKNNLNTSQVSYVCVDNNGKLFRNPTSC